LLYGCEPQELMKVRELENGGLVVIAPTGQKFVYSADQVEKKREELKPRPAARKPATRRRVAKKSDS